MTCGRRQQHFHAKQLSKKRQWLRYKQWKQKTREWVDADLNKISLDHKIPAVDDVIKTSFAIFITLASNYFIYYGTTREMLVNWFRLLFLKTHDEASREDNPNSKQEMNGHFPDEYC